MDSQVNSVIHGGFQGQEDGHPAREIFLPPLRRYAGLREGQVGPSAAAVNSALPSIRIGGWLTFPGAGSREPQGTGESAASHPLRFVAIRAEEVNPTIEEGHPLTDHRQTASTSSVRNRWSTTVSRISICTPLRCMTSPVHAIIAPLSMHRSPGGTNIFAPRSVAIRPTIS